MAWVVDTCLVIDVLDDDPEFGAVSAGLLDARADDGLVLCPVSYIELAPAFLGEPARQDEFLERLGIETGAEWERADTRQAHSGWTAHVQARRAGTAVKRPIADVMIGAFAMRHQGLLTRNTEDFRALFPNLSLIAPEPTPEG